MNTKYKRLLVLLVVSLILMLTACIGFGDPLDAENQEKIDQQIRESIEKTFPLPEQVVIKTHIGDYLRFSKELSVDEVVIFYRDAYTQKGFAEGKNAKISVESATLLFKKDGEKDVALEGTKNDAGSDVHLFLK